MTLDPTSARQSAPLPAWYPDWARKLAELYFSGTTCLFVLHGNVHDLVRWPSAAGDVYGNLAEFLSTQVFGSWDVVLHHDLGRGLRPLAGNDPARLQSMVQYLTGRLGEPASWPRDADQVLHLIDKFVERTLLSDPAEGRKRVGVVLDYAQYLTPAADIASLARGEGARLVRLLGWAQNPYIKRVNVAFCLIADKLSEVNERLIHNPHVATIEIRLPEREERARFIRAALPAAAVQTGDLTHDQLADVSSGLTLTSINVLLAQARQSGERVDARSLGRLKKSLVERQCQGLIEFIEPAHTLDLVVGHQAAIRRLRDDAQLIARGEFDAAPMGYLISGPVGTGKTFLAECYAGDIGIPCLKLRNFRSKYVGETEGNLEQVLNVLRSLGPVVVMIDEADAALGNRRAEGDSGTSSRVFSMIASQMGDTRYRGKIIWMLLTCRPDLLPIDLKRQGRAEVHIPLFYPHEQEEFAAMLRAMAKKNKAELAPDAIGEMPIDRQMSGADLESVLLAAKRAAAAAGLPRVGRTELEQALAEFIPSAQGLEKELQEIAAVLECTQQAFLTDVWRAKISQPGGRAQLQERLATIRGLLED